MMLQRLASDRSRPTAARPPGIVVVGGARDLSWATALAVNFAQIEAALARIHVAQIKRVVLPNDAAKKTSIMPQSDASSPCTLQAAVS